MSRRLRRVMTLPSRICPPMISNLEKSFDSTLTSLSQKSWKLPKPPQFKGLSLVFDLGLDPHLFFCEVFLQSSNRINMIYFWREPRASFLDKAQFPGRICPSESCLFFGYIIYKGQLGYAAVLVMLSNLPPTCNNQEEINGSDTSSEALYLLFFSDMGIGIRMSLHTLIEEPKRTMKANVEVTALDTDPCNVIH
ncbi:hypothetical protein VNO77_27812 [Canavalia gladiata]|uniref:Uncharacterized protein n=1 Tax=Canavalia gladiata TaxID=3824 RepID=A0AAN9KUT8_CANGL